MRALVGSALVALLALAGAGCPAPPPPKSALPGVVPVLRERCAARYRLELSQGAVLVSLEAETGARTLAARYSVAGEPFGTLAWRYSGREVFFSKEAGVLLKRCEPGEAARLSVEFAEGPLRLSTSLPRVPGEGTLSPETLSELAGALLVVGREEEISALGGALVLLPGAQDPAPLLALAGAGEALLGAPEGARLVVVAPGAGASPGRDAWLAPGPGLYQDAAQALVGLWGAEGAWSEYFAALLPGRAGLEDTAASLARLGSLSGAATRLFCYDAFLLERGARCPRWSGGGGRADCGPTSKHCPRSPGWPPVRETRADSAPKPLGSPSRPAEVFLCMTPPGYAACSTASSPALPQHAPRSWFGAVGAAGCRGRAGVCARVAVAGQEFVRGLPWWGGRLWAGCRGRAGVCARVVVAGQEFARGVRLWKRGVWPKQGDAQALARWWAARTGDA